MAIDLSSNKTMYDDIRGHVGHALECVAYGRRDDPENVAIECMDCGVVLVDADRGDKSTNCNEVGCVYSTGSKDGCTLGSKTYPHTCSELD